MTETASQMHLAAAGAKLQPCDHCGTPFKPRRGWGRFCKDKCRNDFHAREARIEAIRARAVQMYEALLRVAAFPDPDLDDAKAYTLLMEARSSAAEAIKDLKAP